MKSFWSNYLLTAVGLTTSFLCLRVSWRLAGHRWKLTSGVIISLVIMVIPLGCFYPDLADFTGDLTWEQRFESELRQLQADASRGPEDFEVWSNFSKMSPQSANYKWYVRSKYSARVGLTVGVATLILSTIIGMLVKRRPEPH